MHTLLEYNDITKNKMFRYLLQGKTGTIIKYIVKKVSKYQKHYLNNLNSWQCITGLMEKLLFGDKIASL